MSLWYSKVFSVFLLKFSLSSCIASLRNRQDSIFFLEEGRFDQGQRAVAKGRVKLAMSQEKSNIYTKKHDV